jgi:hypothetical protein
MIPLTFHITQGIED